MLFDLSLFDRFSTIKAGRTVYPAFHADGYNITLETWEARKSLLVAPSPWIPGKPDNRAPCFKS